MKEQTIQTSTAVQQAIEHFRHAQQAQRADVDKMEGITGDIHRCQQQKQETDALNEQAGTQWRDLFRKMRGQVSPEIKQQQLQRLADQEMARELGELLVTLDIEKDRQELQCSASGAALLQSHGRTLMAYASEALTQALSAELTPLVRAMAIKRKALEIEQAFVTQNGMFSEYEQNPQDTVLSEVSGYLKTAMSGYSFDMGAEPVLAQIGLNRPAVKYTNPKMVSSGARAMAALMIKRKAEQLGTGEKLS